MWRHGLPILVVLLLVGISDVVAQERPTVVSIQPSQPKSVVEVVPEEPHSPRKAILLSILPGAGQVYNGQAWKVPIIYGGFALAGFYMYTNYHKMRDFRDEYLWRIKGGTPELDGYTHYPDASIYNYYQSYNQSFQLSIILSVLLYSLNLVDAFVYGHLYEFQINDDISMTLQPNVDILPYNPTLQPVTGLTCTLKF